MLCHSAENRTVGQYSSSGSALVTEMSRLNLEPPIRTVPGREKMASLTQWLTRQSFMRATHAIGTFTLTET